MTSRDVTETLELALQTSGCDQVDVTRNEKELNNRPSRSVVCTINDTPRNMTMRNKTLH
jgi:hypothetical protein